MNNMLPSISVIIPTFNREKYLGEAIESILEQDYQPIEIIVVDDGSTDNTKALISTFPTVKYVYQENSGQAAARNQGIAISKGEYLAFLDSDDLWIPGKLHSQMNYMQNHPEIKILFGHVQQFSPDEYKTLHGKEATKILPGLFFGTFFIRKKDFLEIGYLQTQLHVGEFIEWFTRAKETGFKYHTLKDIVMKRRLHDTNLGLQQQSGPNNFAQILKASLDRKREQSLQNKDKPNE